MVPFISKFYAVMSLNYYGTNKHAYWMKDGDIDVDLGRVLRFHDFWAAYAHADEHGIKNPLVVALYERNR